MKKRLFALLALVLCLSMCFGIVVGCTPVQEQPADPTEEPGGTDPTEEPGGTDTTEAPVDVNDPDAYWAYLYPDLELAERQEDEVADGCDPEMPLVVGYNQFSGKFSPFFADTSYDVDVAGMTQVSLMNVDRAGQPIMNGIQGEYRTYNGTEYFYNGTANLSVEYDEATDTTAYTAIIRPDIFFSDGERATIDDVIFTYYLYLDTDYQGSTTLNSYDIIGLNEYRTQTSTEILAQYEGYIDFILEQGFGYTVDNNTPEGLTQEMIDTYWDWVDEKWLTVVEGIANYIAASYHSDAYIAAYLDPAITLADVQANDALAMGYAMSMWGFGSFARNADGDLIFTAAPSQTAYNITAGEGPTIETYAEETKLAYNHDPFEFYTVESAGGDEDPGAYANQTFIETFGQEAMGGATVPNIAGIEKITPWEVKVTLNGYSATAVYSILGQQITPLHYYGNEELYDYENNMFGFNRGDLSKAYGMLDMPMGAGPYKFVEYSNRIVYFEANDLYYQAKPMTKYVQFKESSMADIPAAVDAGTIDAASDVTGSVAVFNEISSYNENGTIQGDSIWTYQVDNNGYGYIGMNADTVLVGSDPGSDASKNLRKAFATLLSVYRESVIESYYGLAATVIQYPISTVSWASPQPADADYEIAFSEDVNGNPIYTDGMSSEDRYAAALQAAAGYFEAAGFTFENGVATAAPDGAKLSYEVIIPADGIGDHPAYHILVNTSAALETIGITLSINDPAQSSVLWDALDAGTQELWAAAWGGAIDPDMYQVYHSSNIVGLGGSDSNHYHLQSSELDELIMLARTSDDQDVRKAMYKQCLDIILDWAVEIPTYQRKNCAVVSPLRVNLDTITPDVTTNWGWAAEIYLVQMYAAG